jgi:sec-independent protein translocase protein TatC
LENQNETVEETNYTFLDHLEELRKRIIIILISFIVLTVGAYFFKEQIYYFLIEPLDGLDLKLIHIKVFDKFLAFLKISLYTGIVLSFPIIIHQLSKFILPALYSHEKKWYFRTLGVIIILFFLGAFFAYKVLTPMSLQFLIQFGNEKKEEVAKANKENNDTNSKKTIPDNIVKPLLSVNEKLSVINSQLKTVIQEKTSDPEQLIEINKNLTLIYQDFQRLNENINILKPKKENKWRNIESNLSISDYFDWILIFVLMIGVVFQLPLVMTVLAKIGIVSDKSLGKFRPYALILILVTSALITPPDLISQVLVGIPVYLLYEVSILLARIIRKRRERSEQELEEEV